MLIRKQSWIVGSQYCIQKLFPILIFLICGLNSSPLPPSSSVWYIYSWISREARRGSRAGLGCHSRALWELQFSPFYYFMDLLGINVHLNLKPVQIKSQRKKRRKFRVKESKWEGSPVKFHQAVRAVLGKENVSDVKRYVKGKEMYSHDKGNVFLCIQKALCIRKQKEKIFNCFLTEIIATGATLDAPDTL